MSENARTSRLRLHRNGDLGQVAALTGRKLRFSGVTVGWLGIGVVRGCHECCGICGGRRDVRQRGWTDEGDSMPTCSNCGGPA